jgi:hypothetical protein
MPNPEKLALIYRTSVIKYERGGLRFIPVKSLPLRVEGTVDFTYRRHLNG